MEVRVSQLRQGQVIAHPEKPGKILILKSVGLFIGMAHFEDTSGHPYYLAKSAVVTLSAIGAEVKES